MNKIKLNFNKISIILFEINLFTSVLFQYTIVNQITLALFSFVAILKMIKVGSLRFNLFFFLNGLLLLFSMVQIFGDLVVDVPSSTRMTLTMAINYVYLFLLFNFLITTKENDYVFSRFSNSMLFSAVTLLVFKIINILSGVNSSFIYINIGSLTRILNPNEYSIIMVTTLIVLISYKNDRFRLKDLIKILILLSIILVSMSRKSYLLLGFSLPVILLLKYPKKRLVISFLYFCLILLTVTMISIIPSLRNSIGSEFLNLFDYILNGRINESSIRTRDDLIKTAIEQIKLRPVIGYGADSFYLTNVTGNYSHNNFIEVLYSFGFLGFILYYAGYLSVLVRLANDYRKKNNKMSLYFSFYLFFLIMIEYGQVTYFNRNFLIVFVLAIAIPYLSKRNYNNVK